LKQTLRAEVRQQNKILDVMKKVQRARR